MGIRITRCAWGGLPGAAVILTSACSDPFATIDGRVNELLAEGTSNVGGGATLPYTDPWPANRVEDRGELDIERPATWNPSAEEMTWTSLVSTEAGSVIDRLNAVDATDEEALLTLDEALQWAVGHAFDYTYAEEEFVLACLNLLVQRHLWTPQIANDITAEHQHYESSTAFAKSSSAIVNDLSVTQKLPWGGQVAANYLATFSHLVHGEGSSTPDATQDNAIGQFTLSASIPFLRNAGPIARESIIQSERNLIYASRAFEGFRRQFFVDVVQAYLALQVQKQELDNALDTISLLERMAERQRALYDAGRARLYDAAESENQALQQRSQVAGMQEAYRLAVDRFKILINYPVQLPVLIERASFSIAPPSIDLENAVQIALGQRLDLQSRRDQLIDGRRQVRNALNQLLPDLDLAGSLRLGSADEYYYSFTIPSVEDLETEISLTLGLPLNRTNERIAVRQAQVELERSRRQYSEFRDEIAVNVRNAVRTIDASLLSYDIQRRNVEIAQLNIESIDADPDTYTVIDQTQAIRSLQQARNGRARAFRTVQQSILNYLLDTGQLRVSPEGGIIEIPGMNIERTASLSFEQDEA
ncbi:MAG: TolC family protein [Phycisphaerales bacterium]|nr:TolC family protein [Phycisphaerales bacterium]